jgi:hypothetical protein
LFSSTNKTDRHDITEILLKVALNTITLNQTYLFFVDLALKGDEDIITVSRFPFSLSAQLATHGLNLLLQWKGNLQVISF